MKKRISIFLISILGLSLASCDHEVATSAIVHEDGSAKRSIRFERTDDCNEDLNHFGLNPDDWKVTIDSSKKERYILFEKSFKDVEVANLELDSENDSLFRIHSEFHKSFRWFYSYIYYSDTYRAINRFRHLSADQYLTPEDMAFIDRLPAEGSPISVADSLFLEDLGSKIYEQFLVNAFVEEHLNILKELITTHDLGNSYLEKLESEKEDLINKVEKGFEGREDLEENLALFIADSIGLQLTEAALNDYPRLLQDLNGRLDFMTWANDGDFIHTLQVPWQLVETNADSVDGNTLTWKPPVTKLLFKDYEMHAVVRKINYWAVTLSGLIVLLAIFLLIPRRRNVTSPGV